MLEAHRYAAGPLAYFGGKLTVLIQAGPLGKAGRRNGGLAFAQATHLRNERMCRDSIREFIPVLSLQSFSCQCCPCRVGFRMVGPAALLTHGPWLQRLIPRQQDIEQVVLEADVAGQAVVRFAQHNRVVQGKVAVAMPV